MIASSERKKSTEKNLLRQERDVEKLLQTVPPEVLGSRMARVRQRMGLSIRELAAAANVNKNSIVRLEKGGAPQAMTVVKLCAAMNIHIDRLANPWEEKGETVAIHRHEDDRWYDMVDFGGGPVADRPLNDVERVELSENGLLAPMLMLKSRLQAGQLIPNVIELYGESVSRSHLGEEMVFVLKGTAKLKVGPQVFELQEGESATFWSSEEHSYAPADRSPVPVKILSVVVQQRGKG